MPRMNLFGDVAAGVVGIASINKVGVFPNCSQVKWLNANEIIFQDLTVNPPVLTAYNKSTGALRTVQTLGANFISAEGGAYYAWLGGYGMFDNTGYNNRDGFPGDVGFDAWALVRKSNAIDNTVALITPSGEVYKEFPFGSNFWCCRDKETIAWAAPDGKWYNPAELNVWNTANNLRLYNYKGQTWAMYNGPYGFILHTLEDKTRGYILGTQGMNFNPDFIIYADVVHYTYSTNQQESPEAINIGALSLTTSMVALPPVTIPTLKNPQVTITSDPDWIGKDGLKNGQIFAGFDRENPELGYKFEIEIRNGSIYAKISNKVGTGETGKFRPVKLG